MSLPARPELLTERTREFLKERGFPEGVIHTSPKTTGAGVGSGAATLLPCAMVIANWFGPRNRGIAMGITFTGTSLGGAVMVMIADRAIDWGGWRAGYVTLAIPMIVIVVPLVLLMMGKAKESPAILGFAARCQVGGWASRCWRRSFAVVAFFVVAASGLRPVRPRASIVPAALPRCLERRFLRLV